MVVAAAFSASFVSFSSFSPLARHPLAAAPFAAASGKRQHVADAVPKDEEGERARFPWEFWCGVVCVSFAFNATKKRDSLCAKQLKR
jgi:hypothetical protein